MRIRAVLFDFGDTLVDTPTQFDFETCLFSLHESLVRNGISIPYKDCKRAYSEISEKYFVQNSVREVTFVSIVAELLKRFGYSLKPTHPAVIEAADAYVEPFVQARTMEQSVPSVLQGLIGRYKLGIVSNHSHPPALWKTLKRFDLLNLFEVIIVSADVGWRKPSPKIFKKALRAMHVAASESVFIGDELDHDVEGAQNVGMRTILLKKPTTKELDHRVEPDETIYGFNDLSRALGSIQAKVREKGLNSMSDKANTGF